MLIRPNELWFQPQGRPLKALTYFRWVSLDEFGPVQNLLYTNSIGTQFGELNFDKSLKKAAVGLREGLSTFSAWVDFFDLHVANTLI